eukprot:1150565-Pelagomonas_calceolata.AAC.12
MPLTLKVANKNPENMAAPARTFAVQQRALTACAPKQPAHKVVLKPQRCDKEQNDYMTCHDVLEPEGPGDPQVDVDIRNIQTLRP